MTSRRGFLGGLMSLALAPVAALAVPAPTKVVFKHAANVGKSLPLGRGYCTAIFHVDEPPFQREYDNQWIPDDLDQDSDQIIESVYNDGGWHIYSQVRKGGVLSTYIDGVEVTYLPEVYAGWNGKKEPAIFSETITGDFKEVDFSNLAARPYLLTVTTPTRRLALRDGKLVVRS